MDPMLATVLVALFAECGQSIHVYPLKKKWDTSVCPKVHQKQLPDWVSAACAHREYKVEEKMLVTNAKDEPCQSLSALFLTCHQSQILNFLTPFPLDVVKNEQCSGAMTMRAICVTANGTMLIAMGCKKNGTVDDVSRNPKWKALCGIHTYDKQVAEKEACIPMRLAIPVSIGVMLAVIFFCLLAAVFGTRKWCSGEKGAQKTVEPQTPIATVTPTPQAPVTPAAENPAKT